LVTFTGENYVNRILAGGGIRSFDRCVRPGPGQLLASAQNQASLQRLLDAARTALQPFVSAAGCTFPAQAHIIVAQPGSS
jgi:hypothetical protein